MRLVYQTLLKLPSPNLIGWIRLWLRHLSKTLWSKNCWQTIEIELERGDN